MFGQVIQILNLYTEPRSFSLKKCVINRITPGDLFIYYLDV